MPTIPKRVKDRLIAGVKKYQAVLASAKSRDVNESDTVVILNDILADLYGYDKYFEITSEFAIRSTYCDLAIQLDGKTQMLIEAKAVGIDLKNNHLKQAVDYAANQGVDWVVLTNGLSWQIYKVLFNKPIDHELVCEYDFCAIDPKKEQDLQMLFLLTKEGWAKSAVGDFHQQRQALSRFYVAASALSEAVLNVIRRELRRASPGIPIEINQIEAVLRDEVIKREVFENEKFQTARKNLGRVAGKALRAPKEKQPMTVESTIVTLARVALPAAPLKPTTD